MANRPYIQKAKRNKIVDSGNQFKIGKTTIPHDPTTCGLPWLSALTLVKQPPFVCLIDNVNSSMIRYYMVDRLEPDHHVAFNALAKQWFEHYHNIPFTVYLTQQQSHTLFMHALVTIDCEMIVMITGAIHYYCMDHVKSTKRRRRRAQMPAMALAKQHMLSHQQQINNLLEPIMETIDQDKQPMTVEQALEHILRPTRYVGETTQQYDFRMIKRKEVIEALTLMGTQDEILHNNGISGTDNGPVESTISDQEV
jgi:hypothetical protein